MDLKNFLKPTSATFGFIVFSVSLFTVGYHVGGLTDNNKVTERDKILSPFLLSLILPGAALVNFFINKQVKDESERQIIQNEKNCENKVKNYAFHYLNSLDKVEIILRKLNDEDSQKCMIEVVKLKSEVQEYVDKYDAAQVMVKWLDNDQLHHKLLMKIVLATQKEEPKIIPGSTVEQAFSNDINKCLNWLRDSIDVLDSRSVDRQYMTTALTPGMLDKFEAYEYALTYIFRTYFKNQKELKNLCNLNNVSESDVRRILEEYVKNLIAKLKNDKNIKQRN